MGFLQLSNFSNKIDNPPASKIYVGLPIYVIKNDPETLISNFPPFLARDRFLHKSTHEKITINYYHSGKCLKMCGRN